MGGRDIATQTKAFLNFRKDKIKQRKIVKCLTILCLTLATLGAGIYYYSKDTIVQYNEKHTTLTQEKEKLVEEQEKLVQEQETLKTEKEELLSNAELIAKNNQKLIEENIALQNSLKMAASVGVKPKNYDDADTANSAVDYSKLEYVGEFEGTAYTPSAEECGNNLGYTASGEPIIAGVSIAVDTKYWKLGTKFYIEGLGYVVAMDTGSAVKGRYRFDYAVFDKDFAYTLGRRDWKVYKVIEE